MELTGQRPLQGLGADGVHAGVTGLRYLEVEGLVSSQSLHMKIVIVGKEGRKRITYHSAGATHCKRGDGGTEGRVEVNGLRSFLLY